MKAGSTSLSSGFLSYNECHTLPNQVDVGIPPELSGLSVVVANADLDLLGRYVGIGTVQHEQQMQFVCTFGGGSTQTWYVTSQWWPYPQSGEVGYVSPDGRVIKGGVDQMDGDYRLTSLWQLETVGP